METKTFLRIEEFIADLKKEYSESNLNRGDEWLLEIEGDRFFKNSEFEEAENRFKALIYLNPKYYYGYELLSLVYEYMGKKHEALLLIDYAIELAKKALMIGDLDSAVINNMIDKKRLIGEKTKNEQEQRKNVYR